MATSILYPNGDGTKGGWAEFAPTPGNTTNIYTDIDEGTDSPNDSDAISNNTASNSGYFLLTDTPADVSVVTAVTVKTRGYQTSSKGSPITQYIVQIVQSDESTALTDTATITPSTTITTSSSTLNITGLTTKTAWDGARLKITTGAGSSGAIAIHAAQVHITYTATGGSGGGSVNNQKSITMVWAKYE